MKNLTQMKGFVQKLVDSSPNSQNLVNWIEAGFNTDNVPDAAVDELVQIMEKGDDKTKMALSDLLRLLILETAPSS